MYFSSVTIPQESTNVSMDEILFWGLMAVLASYIFEGPLRYCMAIVGIPNAIYFRDVICSGTIGFVFLRSLIARAWIEAGIAIVMSALFFHFLIGILSGQAIFPALFSLKIFLSIAYGAAVWTIVAARFRIFLFVLAAFFIASVMGVFLNKLVQQMPWEGQVYETAFGAVNTTKEWWSSGERRLPGFARTSYDAATMIGITGLAAILLTHSVARRLVVVVLGMTAIEFTTSKGMVLAYGLIGLWSLIPSPNVALSGGKGLTRALCLLALAMPVMVVIFDLGDVVPLADVPSGFSSLWERFTYMWPTAISLLMGPEQFVFGKGLGSMGTSMQFGPDQNLYNSADNLFVYIYVVCGIFGPMYLLGLTWRLLQAKRTDEIGFWFVGFLIITFAYGLTTNMFEQTFFCSLLGLLFGAAFAGGEKNAI